MTEPAAQHAGAMADWTRLLSDPAQNKLQVVWWLAVTGGSARNAMPQVAVEGVKLGDLEGLEGPVLRCTQ